MLLLNDNGMKLKTDCTLRRIAGENIIIRPGEAETDMTRVVSLNGTAAWLWERLWGREFTAGEAAELLAAAYEVEQGQAAADAERWLDVMRQNGLLV